jgi:acetolactate synthase-1/2/3 large subunit
MVEYHPDMWNPDNDKKIVHIDALPGGGGRALRRGRGRPRRHQFVAARTGAEGTAAESHAVQVGAQGDHRGPRRVRQRSRVSGQAAEDRLGSARRAGPEDIAISDVGAHKMWMARMYKAERPNTCIISNGFASMGIAVPGAIAAKLAYPERKVIAVTGDAGFLMNSQEIETAIRLVRHS